LGDARWSVRARMADEEGDRGLGRGRGRQGIGDRETMTYGETGMVQWRLCAGPSIVLVLLLRRRISGGAGDIARLHP
jgi:hypothetical protein